MTAPERFFFVHLQKTGGTALYQRLRDHFGVDAVYPTPADQGSPQAVIDVGFLTERYAVQRDSLQVVTGHFPLCATEVLGEPFTTFTVLRDPVERTLSLLRRRSVAEDRFLGMELEAIYDDAILRPIITNHMVKMLSLTVEEMGDAPLVLEIDLGDSHLERAQANLEHRIDAFGFQEDFDTFCGLLTSRFGWDLGPPRFANRTKRVPVDDGLRERIAADNSLDVELYRFARDLAAG